MTYLLVTYCIAVLHSSGIESTPQCHTISLPTDLTPMQCQMGLAGQQIVAQWAEGKAGIHVVGWRCGGEERV